MTKDNTMDLKVRPVAWRCRYIYSGEPSFWRVRQTPVMPFEETTDLAGLEVEPLYGPEALAYIEKLEIALREAREVLIEAYDDTPGWVEKARDAIGDIRATLSVGEPSQ